MKIELKKKKEIVLQRLYLIFKKNYYQQDCIKILNLDELYFMKFIVK